MMILVTMEHQCRYGRIGIYKSFMFGSPTILVTIPELCKQVLMDEERFPTGWPQTAVELMGKKSFIGISAEEHKRLRKLTSAPVNGHEALSVYLEYIENQVVSTLEKWSNMGEIEYLSQVRKLTFRIIMYVFLSEASEDLMVALEKEYSTLNYGVRAMQINVPGFAYYKALKARKNLVRLLQSVVDERRTRREKCEPPAKKDMMDNLMDCEDENGRKLTDEEIIDVLIMYLNAGHESSGHTIMWVTVLLEQHPDVFHKAKAEQEEIVRNMPPTQKGVTLKEFRQMEYLNKVIDEVMRFINISLMVFRVASADVNINGYLIPKGWKVQVWLRNVHKDPEVHPDANKFDPSRWDRYPQKAGTFIPFGMGSRLCPGNDLAKLEIAVYLHHFLLNYRLERVNPNCRIMNLPHRRPTDNCLGRIKKNSG
ncbi:hypothetical protein AQUCO_04400113v1 [Aquilegia coerulea]|uniref:Ent-kaurenoic acid oxidase n=1 Tax=Aquilegia coerulea TaxID=218851 RepID=A0A2G5CN40_AQUCA|nr:hypothetical protein AQUCO_04400113v1 [Aquilegia coerulea]